MTRAQIGAAGGVVLLVVVLLAWWQQDVVRMSWWDSRASRGPDASALAELQDCGSPGWTGWVTVATADVAMPCGEPAAAAQLADRLAPSVRRRWLRGHLADGSLGPRARWRITRALELAGSPVETSTVALVVEGQLGESLATEILLADGGPRSAREAWVATRLRGTRGESLDTLDWRQVTDAAYLSGEPGPAIESLRGALQLPVDLEPRLHALPESWARALQPALACGSDEMHCVPRWADAVSAIERRPEGEPLAVEDEAVDAPADHSAVELGLLDPLARYEQLAGTERLALGRLLRDQAEREAAWDGASDGQASSLSQALWFGRMGPWTRALWIRELTRRAGIEGDVRRSEGHLLVTMGPAAKTLCGKGKVTGKLESVLDPELVARALLELHPDADAAAARLAGWTGPDHVLFGATGTAPPPPDPCGPTSG